MNKTELPDGLVKIIDRLVALASGLSEIVIAKGLCTDDELMDIVDREFAELRANKDET